MCFSAPASFSTGIILTGIGIISIVHARGRQKAFASIPLLFGVQQIAEGFLWLALKQVQFSHWEIPSTYVFLFFAQVLWPFWVPFSVLRMQEFKSNKPILRLLLFIGTAIAAYLAYCLFRFPVKASAESLHISYALGFPEKPGNYGAFLYFLATIAPPFFSSIKKMWILGLMILFSYIIASVFYDGYVVSVWCFFAAIISLAIWLILNRHNKTLRISSS